MRAMIADARATLRRSGDKLETAVQMLEDATEGLLEMAWGCECREDPVDGEMMVVRGRRVRVVVCEVCRAEEMT